MKKNNKKNQENLPASDKIENLVASMALNNNFWGYLFGRIRKVSSESVPSIMGVGLNTRGKITLFYNKNLVENTDYNNLKWVLTHEGGHLLNNHISRFLRLTSVDTDQLIIYQKSIVWNIASDCAVNEQCGFPEKLVIDGKDWPACHPKNYNFKSGMASESYYSDLYNQAKNNCPMCGQKMTEDKNGNKQCQSGSGAGDQKKDDQNQEGSDQQGNSDKEQKENKPGEGSSGGEGNQPQQGKCPYCGGDCEVRMIDDHSEWTKGCGSQTPEEMARRAEDQLRKIVRSASKSFKRNSGRGSMPGYIKELIEELLDIPKIPYYEIIRSLVRGSKLAKFKKSYTRVNKKRVYTFFNNGEYIQPIISPFPGKTKDFTFKIAIMIDTSGSQSPEDIAEALSGCKDIIEKDKYVTVHIVECDTVVGKEYQVKKISDIDFEVTGRGGTILEPGVHKCKELNPDIMLGFTDGYCDDINSFPDTVLPRKIIWIISPGGSEERLNKTGPVVYIEKDD